MRNSILKQIVFYKNSGVYVSGAFKPKRNCNILQFKNDNYVLSDSDINHMFNAFVNLIKKNTLLKYETMYKNKTKYLVDRLNDALIELNKKDEQIVELTKLCGQTDSCNLHSSYKKIKN